VPASRCACDGRRGSHKLSGSNERRATSIRQHGAYPFHPGEDVENRPMRTAKRKNFDSGFHQNGARKKLAISLS
jgi:hypothetical protein